MHPSADKKGKAVKDGIAGGKSESSREQGSLALMKGEGQKIRTGDGGGTHSCKKARNK